MQQRQFINATYKLVLLLLLAWFLISPKVVLSNTYCHDLPLPSGTVITADPSDNLQEIVSTAEPETTIMLAAGLYELNGNTLWLSTNGISIRGVSGNRQAVILDGAYNTNEIMQISASNITIADLTIKRAIHHPIHITPNNIDVLNTLIYNVHIIDPGQQAIKINPNAERTYFPDAGEIACSRIELTESGRSMVWNINNSCYTGGIDAHQARAWLVRDNEIEGFWCQNGISEHGIHFWRGSRDTQVVRNTLVNNVRGIGFGLMQTGTDARTYEDDPCPGVTGYISHYGGLIQNNMIVQNSEELQQSEFGFDSGIALAQSCATSIVHNSVASTETPFSSIEYRFPNTSASIINNLVSHNILKRQEALAALAGNITGASLTNFVDPDAGDLNLVRDSIALNQGVDPGLGEYTDLDGQVRMQPSDVGGDENNPGDIDGNGSVNLKDAIIALQILIASNSESTFIYSQADMDGDGKLGMQDAIAILESLTYAMKSARGSPSPDGATF